MAPFSLAAAWKLTALRLGEERAVSFGLDTRRLRLMRRHRRRSWRRCGRIWRNRTRRRDMLELAHPDKPVIHWSGFQPSGKFADFRKMTVVAVIDLTPHMRRITLSGSDQLAVSYWRKGAAEGE